MSLLSPALAFVLANQRLTIFAALSIDLPDQSVRLLDGSAEVEIGEELYRGKDPDFGVWDSIDEMEDGTGDEAPAMTVSILPASDAIAAAISDPSVQGSEIALSIGAVNEATGAVIGDPYLAFLGEIDVPTHTTDLRVNAVEYDCVGGMEEFFFEDEGIRLSSTFHRQVWPDEAGMDHATGVTDNIYWGAKEPAGAVTSGSGTGWASLFNR